MKPIHYLLGLWLLITPALAQLPEGLVDTQDPETSPPTPQESLEMLSVPEGFEVTLFAAEPDVAQPIAINYDDRGRLWVAESFSYIEWERRGQDRISIFEDTDNDGVFDSRKVFWDKANHLSGFQIGYGGVWVCDAPQLLFIPDTDGDDVPDGEPQVMLDGWALNAEHNFFNGLTWGPDGWLYGRHGIKRPSLVGKPGTPDEERIELSCSIWRFHPVRHEFEVYADGTVNPWGLDWNAEGQPFITTSVVDHLWHLVPGARYKRWEGRGVNHPNPYTYEQMQPASDHRHWVGGEKERKTYGATHDEAGGGHSHCGLMIYQSEQWPEEFRGRAFFSNVLGQRINMDHLERRHSGYNASHGKDFLRSSSQWFRAVDLKQGPYGEVMVAEWTDLGECHDRDGIHRTSGRLYQVWHGERTPAQTFDMAAHSTEELLTKHLFAPNAWARRHALRILYERAVEGGQLTDNQKDRLIEVAIDGAVPDAIIAVQTLHAFANEEQSWREQVYEAALTTADPDSRDAIRAQLITLTFTERTPGEAQIQWLEAVMPRETSPLVRMAMASALQRIPVEQRWGAASTLVEIAIPEEDRNLALMLWYGMEPTVASDPSRAMELALSGVDSFLARSVTRRAIAADSVGPVLAALEAQPEAANVAPVLEGMLMSLPGRTEMPEEWPDLYAKLRQSQSKAVTASAARLALAFGDAEVEQEMVAQVRNAKLPRIERLELMDLLVSAKSKALGASLWDLTQDTEIGAEAIRAVAAFPSDDSASQLLRLLGATEDSDRQAAILQTLASRQNYAEALVEALKAGDIPREIVPAYIARQLLTVAPKRSKFAEFWGFDGENAGEKAALLAKWKDRLPEHYLAEADLSNGHLVYQRTCSACHKLYGEGGEIGPNLTGSNRANLDYFLLSVLFPSEDVSEDYKVVTLSLSDGRTLVGNILEENDQVLTFRQVSQIDRIDRSLVVARQTLDMSLMPAGLLDALSREEVRDLVGYLRTTAPLDSTAQK